MQKEIIDRVIVALYYQGVNNGRVSSEDGELLEKFFIWAEENLPTEVAAAMLKKTLQ